MCLQYCHSIVCSFSYLGEHGFICDGNRCLRKQVVCDGLIHCKDETDELPETCVTTTCPPDKFQCHQSKQCISRSFLCDGHAECADKSDEMENCTECPEFRCNNGLCVLAEKLCDGINQCTINQFLISLHKSNDDKNDNKNDIYCFHTTGGDFSDEEKCSHECKKDEYFCHPNGCLTPDKLCDGIVHCFNAFDEEGCMNTTQSSSNDTKKINKSQKNAKKNHHCGPHEFQCKNWSECVPLAARCDSYQDCFDR